MGDGDIFDVKGGKIEARAGLDEGDADVRRTGLGKSSCLDQTRSEGRGEHFAFEFRPKRRKRADVILMRMRDHDREKIASKLLDRREVGQHDFDAGEIRSRKAQTAIDEDPFARAGRPVAVKRGVHADLAQTSKRREYEIGVLLRHQ